MVPVIVAHVLEKIREHDIIFIAVLYPPLDLFMALLFWPLENCFRVVVSKKSFWELDCIFCSDSSHAVFPRKPEDCSKVGISPTCAQTEDELCLSAIKHIVTQQFL